MDGSEKPSTKFAMEFCNQAEQVSKNAWDNIGVDSFTMKNHLIQSRHW